MSFQAEITRRQFVIAGGRLALMSLTFGTLRELSFPRPALAGSGSGPGPYSVGFGWEVTNFNHSGADVYFRVERSLFIDFVNVDASMSVASATLGVGISQVLFQGGVSRGGPPSISPPPPAYLLFPPSPDFEHAQVHNPNGLTVLGALALQDEFAALILKTFVPSDGAGAQSSRNARVPLGLVVNAGDYLAFHMDHSGIPADAETQVILGYRDQGGCA